MSGDRQVRRSHLRSTEVMNVIQINERRSGEADLATAEIARLFDVAGSEGAAIRLPDGRMTLLHWVLQAIAVRSGLPTAELRAALAFWTQAPRCESA